MYERDPDGVVLRFLCEQAEQRLEQAWAASDVAHRTFQTSDGSYHWAQPDTDEDAPQPR